MLWALPTPAPIALVPMFMYSTACLVWHQRKSLPCSPYPGRLKTSTWHKVAHRRPFGAGLGAEQPVEQLDLRAQSLLLLLHRHREHLLQLSHHVLFALLPRLLQDTVTIVSTLGRHIKTSEVKLPC